MRKFSKEDERMLEITKEIIHMADEVRRSLEDLRNSDIKKHEKRKIKLKQKR